MGSWAGSSVDKDEKSDRGGYPPPAAAAGGGWHALGSPPGGTAGRCLVLAVPLGAILPRLHEPGGHLGHVLLLLRACVGDDAVVEGDARLALLRQLLRAQRAARRHHGVAYPRDRALQRVLVPAYVAHEGRVVARHLRGGLHVPRAVEVGVADAGAREVSQHLQGGLEGLRLGVGAQRGTNP